MTHRRELALYAIAHRWNISLDVEYIDTEVACEAIARRLLSRDEHCQLQRLVASDRRKAFFRCWPRKEAYVSALGGGLSVAPDTSGRAIIALTARARIERRTHVTRLEPGKSWQRGESFEQ